MGGVAATLGRLTPEDVRLGEVAPFERDGTSTPMPRDFTLGNRMKYVGTKKCASGAKGVVREYRSTSDDAPLMLKGYMEEKECSLEKEVSRRCRGVPGLFRTLPCATGPYVVGEWVPLTLRDMLMEAVDRLELLKAVANFVQKLNAKLVEKGAVYLDVTILNVGYRRGEWIMVDLGGAYVRGWGSEVVTPSFVPPFMWSKNLVDCKDRFEVRASEFSFEDLGLVAAYGVLASFAAVAVDRGGNRELAYFLHSDYARRGLRRAVTPRNALDGFLAGLRRAPPTPFVKALEAALAVFLDEGARREDMHAAWARVRA